MRSAIAIGILAAAAAVAGCSQARGESGGPTVERSYPVGPFSRIEVAGHYDVDVRTGSPPSVRASGPEREIERMVVEVRGQTLSIRPERRDGISQVRSSDGTVRVAVTVPSLAAASMAGSGDINVDRVTGESFEAGVAGSGDVRVGEVEVNRLAASVAGSGEIRVGSGRAGRADYEIAGSGDIDAGALRTETAKVSIAGSGNVRASATATASVDIAGSGDVRLSGGAKCSVSKSGSGSVDCS